MTATTDPNRALWEKGDFTRIAATMRESGEALVGNWGSPKASVLDLGCGDGTTAVLRLSSGRRPRRRHRQQARRGRQARAEELGLTNLSFQQGDASN